MTINNRVNSSMQSKHQITTISIIASGSLAALKFIIGIITGSLGLIAEGMHSLLDLLSTFVTFIAVKVAAEPPDANHPYGHERAEALGALAGMTLLGATALFILYHAVLKIVWEPGTPEVTIWSFAVIIISIVVDFFRVRSLKKAAKHYKSQSLSSDAEHFGNDMLGSLSVLLGLLFIRLSQYLPFPVWLVERADAIAALGVVLIACKSVWSIGSQAIRSLMDDVPADITPRLLSRVEAVQGVVAGASTIRTRFVGNKPFVEAIIGTTRDLNFEKAHELTKEIERAIVDELKEDTEVIVHVEPIPTRDEPYAITIRAVADTLNLRIHNLNIYLVTDEIIVDLDLEVANNLTLREAHIKSEMLEQALTTEFSKPIKVAIHIEPRNDLPRPAIREETSMRSMRELVTHLKHANNVRVEEVLITDEGQIVTVTIGMDEQMPLAKAHIIMSELERVIRARKSEIIRVHVDPEPLNRNK